MTYLRIDPLVTEWTHHPEFLAIMNVLPHSPCHKFSHTLSPPRLIVHRTQLTKCEYWSVGNPEEKEEERVRENLEMVSTTSVHSIGLFTSKIDQIGGAGRRGFFCALIIRVGIFLKLESHPCSISKSRPQLVIAPFW